MSVERGRPANPRYPSAVDTLECALGKGMVAAFEALVTDPVWSVRLAEERRDDADAESRFLRLMRVAGNLAALERLHGRGAALSAHDPFVLALAEHGHITQGEIASARSRAGAQA